MRFGLVGYSKHEEYYKIHAALVDKEVDDQDVTANYLHKEKNVNLELGHLKQKVIIDQLINVLKSNGLISDDQVNEIFNVPRKEVRSNQFDLYKVEDIDDFTL